jgi:hypothetical protein
MNAIAGVFLFIAAVLWSAYTVLDAAVLAFKSIRKHQ